MTFDKLIEAALAAPPGSIMFAKQADGRCGCYVGCSASCPCECHRPTATTEFEFVSINGQKPAEA